MTALRLWGAAVTASLAVLLGIGALPAAAGDDVSSRESPGVVLVGVAGLAWPDVTAEDMPNLHGLVSTEGAASLTVRTVRSRTCTVDGWLTLGAGQRATDLADTTGDGEGDRFCRYPPTPFSRDGGVAVPGWSDLSDFQDEHSYGTRIGHLGTRLAESGICATAVGPGAALALADQTGHVRSYLPSLESLSDERLAACPVTIIDAGGLPPADPLEEGDHLGPRRSAAARVDGVLADLRGRLPADTAMLVVGVADSAPTPVPAPEDPLHIAPSGLRVALAVGPMPSGQPWGPTWLTSGSTRWTGLVQLTDVASTLAAYAGLSDPATGTVGRPWRANGAHPSSAESTIAQLVGTDRATQVFRTQSAPFFQILGIGQVLFFGGVLLWLRRVGTHRHRVLRLAQYVALAAASLPVASFLANLTRWWRAERPGTVLWISIVLIAVTIAVTAMAGPWRRKLYGPPGFVAGFTAVVLAVDVSTGGHLQHTSLLGLSPVVAGRFFGFGNIPFAIFVASSLVAAGALAQWLLDRGYGRRVATSATALVGLAAVVTMGAPWAGANFGGTLSTLPGFALLALGVSGARVTVLRMLVAGVAAVAVVTLIAWLDWLRPVASQTHFGNFFGDVMDGEALRVINRKAGASLGTLQRAPYYGWLVPIAYAAIIWLARTPGVAGMRDAYARWSELRYVIWAGLLTGAVGFATNDSGIIIPALLLTVGIPLVVSAVAHGRRDAEGHHVSQAPSPRPATAGRGAAERASQRP